MLGFNGGTSAAQSKTPLPFASAVDQRIEMIDQLRAIRELLKEQNELLREQNRLIRLGLEKQGVDPGRKDNR